MVEVSPKKGPIQIHLGWLFFAILCVVVFALGFKFVDPAALGGWAWHALAAGAVLCAVLDLWWLQAPPAFVILVAGCAVGYGLVWKYYLSV